MKFAIVYFMKGNDLNDEGKLLTYLFRGYNPSARPVINSSDTAVVSLQLSLLQIQELVSAIMSDSHATVALPQLISRRCNICHLLIPIRRLSFMTSE